MTADPAPGDAAVPSPGGTMLKNTLWLTAAAFGGRVVSYGTFILLAWFFTRTEVGVWAVLLTAFLFGEVVSNLGLDKILIRDAARDLRRGEAMLPSVLGVKLFSGTATGVAACACVLLGYPEIARDYPVATVLSFLAVPAIAVTRTLEAWHTATERMQYPAIGQFLERATLVCLLLAVWLGGLPFAWFIGASAAAPLVRLAVAARPLRGHIRFAMPRRLRPLLSESLVLFAVELVAGVYLRVDLILISKLDSLGDAGLYNAAYRLFEFFTAIFSGYLLAIFPSLARKARFGAFRNTFLLGLGVVTAAAVMGILFRTPVLAMFGPSYPEAAPAFAMLMIALPLTYVASFLGNTLVAMGRTRDLLIMAVAVVASNIAFNVLLIPRYSITGAGMAFAMSEALSIAVLFAFTMFSRRAKRNGAAN